MFKVRNNAPTNLKVINNAPTNKRVVNSSPTNSRITSQNFTYTFIETITAGQPIPWGGIYALTYPATQSFTKARD